MPKEKKPKKPLLFAAAVIAAAVLCYAWFFIISPTFVSKPVLPKPALEGAPGEGHLNWAVNELGAYKLHSDPLSGEPPVMEIVVTDLGRTFTSTTINNMPSTTEGAAVNPDIRLKLTSENFARLYKSADSSAEAAALYKEGKAEVELLKDTTTLAAKGYKAIYDEMGM
ncbi:MAG: hypothetical protein QXD77_01315 [Candidatus Aenigmatarchaeota archaeon]